MINPKAPPGWDQADWDEAVRRNEEEKERRAFMAKYPTRESRTRAIASMNRAVEAGRD